MLLKKGMIIKLFQNKRKWFIWNIHEKDSKKDKVETKYHEMKLQCLQLLEQGVGSMLRSGAPFSSMKADRHCLWSFNIIVAKPPSYKDVNTFTSRRMQLLRPPRFSNSDKSVLGESLEFA